MPLNTHERMRVKKGKSSLSTIKTVWSWETLKGCWGPSRESVDPTLKTAAPEKLIYMPKETKKYKDVHYSIVCNSKQQPYPNIGVMDKWNIYIHLQCNFMQHVDISQHGEIAKAMSSK